MADARSVVLIAGTDEIGMGALFKELDQLTGFGLAAEGAGTRLG